MAALRHAASRRQRGRHQALGREQATLEALRHRYEAAQTIEASNRQLLAERVQLEQQVDADLEERRQHIERATLLFNELAQRIYSSTRPAYLSIEAGQSSLRIQPTIDSDDSQGINKITIFCFDLTLAVIAHLEGRGPDFLIHDSHIFDGVDGRQVANALELAQEISEAQGMQYITTINQGTLEEAAPWGSLDLERYVIEPRLTDAYEDGGLFGFHFGGAAPPEGGFGADTAPREPRRTMNRSAKTRSTTSGGRDLDEPDSLW